MNVLIGDEAEELVFDDGTAERATGGVAMQAGNFFAVGNVGVGVVEKRSGVQGVGAAMDVGAAVELLVPEAVLISM